MHKLTAQTGQKFLKILASRNITWFNYILELDPGGSLPGWVANMFAEKGPFGTFSNLAKQLME